MQILPDTFLDRAEDALGAARLPVPGDEGFARALNQSVQDIRNNQADPSAARDGDAADDDATVEQALLAGSPYTPTPELLSPFAPQAVRLTAKEADALAEAMRDDGVSAKALAALRDAGRLPGGATVDQLLLAAREALEGKASALSREEEALLQSLSHKAAGSAGKDVNNLFAEGTPQSALAALMAGLAESPASTVVTVEEMAALAKALRLPQGTARSLLDAFRGESSLTLSGREWNELLAPAKAQIDMAASDMDKLLKVKGALMQVTAPGMEGYDCVSRSFAPKMGVPEDPVCGSGHCHIIPYWAQKLGKTRFVARQASPRGGTLYCRMEGDRVILAGRAVLYARSELMLEDRP